MMTELQTTPMAVAARGPSWLTGTVYGTLLNYRADLAAFAARLQGPPYLAPPKAPILYIKPRNTWIANGAEISLPVRAAAVQVGATLAVIIGRPCVRIRADQALLHVAAVTVINDLCLPHAEIFRPAIKERCRDGFCAIGPAIEAVDGAEPFAEHALCTYINGELRGEWSTRDLVRSLPRLMADVSEFMTLHPGDVLMVGVPRDAPLARRGDRVAVEVTGVGRIENSLIDEQIPEPRTAGALR